MRFLLRWIFREIRNDFWWAFLFVLSLGLGLFGFIALESFRGAIEDSLRSNARQFLSADFSVSSRRPITSEELAKVRDKLQPSEESHLTEFFSMAASIKGSRLVQIKAIDSSYPLYGELRLASGKKIKRGESLFLESEPVVWIYPELLTQLQVAIGDSIKIGTMQFRVADTVSDDSTQTFRLGGLAPKIYFSRIFLDQTELIGPGTTLSDVYLFALQGSTDEDLETFARQLRTDFKDPNLQFSTPFEAAQETGRALQTLLDYLGLVSLVALALALVGVGYLIQLFLARRVSTLSLLRTLGLPGRRAEFFLMAELALLGLLSCVLALPLARLMLPALSGFLSDFLPFPLELGTSSRTFFLSLLLSTLLPILVSWPLLRPLRRLNLKQVLLDRDLWQMRLQGSDWVAWAPAFLFYFGLSVWVSHSVRVAGFFLAGLAGAAVLILMISFVVLKSLPKIGRIWLWRQARLRLSRSPLRFSVVILALGFGTLLLTLLPQIRASLRSELASPEAIHLPSLFLFDIQDEQVGPLNQLLQDKGMQAQNLSPMVRSRLLEVNGKSYERLEASGFESREEETEARFRNRGINLTFRSDLSSSEELFEGRWFSEEKGETAEISVEWKYAERMGLMMGDLLKFDVQGVEIEGRIVNFRKVKWNSFQPNFFVSFQPGFLDEAPKIWLLSVPPLPEEKKNSLQDEIVSLFPNVSIIDVSRVIDKALALGDQMAIALTVMALLSVLVGLFVLFTVLVTEARSRMVEWNLYKVLGASRNSVLRLFLIESFWVLSVAVTLGGALGCLLSFVLMRWMFSAPFQFSWPAFIFAVALPFLLSFALVFRLGSRLTKSEASSLLAEGRL